MGAFTYTRTIHFPDTDAAGVVFFARYLFIAHEAYEEALGAHGVPLAQFFDDQDVIIPITRSEASYLRPLVCGDQVSVTLTPTRTGPDSFAIDYEFKRLGPPIKRAAVIRTEHVCLAADSRQRQDLPASIAAWVDGT